MTKQIESRDWVVTGGAPGETAHCTRCGQGLRLSLPMELYLVAACIKAFANEHNDCQPGTFVEPVATTFDEWLRGRDTGTSSLTILEVLAGYPTDRHDVPHDSDDFGRCFRLLQLFPQFRPRMPEVAARFPEWKPLVDRWAELEALYEEELPSRTAPKLYALMRELQASPTSQ